jgi:hypothetical protein
LVAANRVYANSVTNEPDTWRVSGSQLRRWSKRYR